MQNQRPKTKICVVTGSRADYGLLYWVLREIEAVPALQLQLAVTGMHLSPAFGDTWREIEKDGFHIARKVESLLADDSATGITKSMAAGLSGFADALHELAPDFLLVLGDRFEILVAVQAALIANIPVCHLCGGDITEGAFDDAIRHSITKMSHLHFVTNAEAAARVRQMGEKPAHIFITGSPGIDYIVRMQALSRTELEASLEFKLRKRNLLVTWHPETLVSAAVENSFGELLKTLNLYLDDDTAIIFTRPNADTGNQAINKMLDAFVSSHPQTAAFSSLGQVRYLSLMRHVDVVVGNSSSGLYESPSLKKPSVNIGDRQKGRLLADSVVSCSSTTDDIFNAIGNALTLDCSKTVSPYGVGDSAVRIVAEIKKIADPRTLVRKHFFKMIG